MRLNPVCDLRKSGRSFRCGREAVKRVSLGVPARNLRE